MIRERGRRREDRNGRRGVGHTAFGGRRHRQYDTPDPTSDESKKRSCSNACVYFAVKYAIYAHSSMFSSVR